MSTTIKLEETTDYDKFKVLSGNRNLDRKHIASLQRKMVAEGNLTQITPILVNDAMEVIDGQHRLEALKELGWPVFFIKKKDLNLTSVQALNTGNKNWTWFDYAYSYATQGNKNYVKFLELWDYFGLSYSILIHYASGGEHGRKQANFQRGGFVMGDQKHIFELLKQYQEIAMASEHNNSRFAIALYDVLRSPHYDHKRMLDKMSKYGGGLRVQSKKGHYLIDIQDVYNTYVNKDEQVKF